MLFSRSFYSSQILPLRANKKMKQNSRNDYYRNPARGDKNGALAGETWANYPIFKSTLCVSGQHRDMLDQVLDLFLSAGGS